MTTREYTTELKVWACDRIAEEYQMKIDRLKRRRAAFSVDTLESPITTDAVIRSARVMVRACDADISAFQDKINMAVWQKGRLIDHVKVRLGEDFEKRVLRDTFDIIGSHRIHKYCIILNWNVEKVMYYAEKSRPIMCIQDVDLYGENYRLLCAWGILGVSKRLIAAYGGAPTDFSYREVYNKGVLCAE